MPNDDMVRRFLAALDAHDNAGRNRATECADCDAALLDGEWPMDVLADAIRAAVTDDLKVEPQPVVTVRKDRYGAWRWSCTCGETDHLHWERSEQAAQRDAEDHIRRAHTRQT